MSRSLLGLLVLASGAISSALPAHAAVYAVYPRHERVASRVLQIDRGPNPYCGPRCGCPIAVQVRHRSLEQAYSSAFDPRTKGEPHYYYGANRTYVRYEIQPILNGSLNTDFRDLINIRSISSCVFPRV